MEEEIKLELGYELLSLVNKEHGTLLDGITKLRELHPEIPKIRIIVSASRKSPLRDRLK